MKIFWGLFISKRLYRPIPFLVKMYFYISSLAATEPVIQQVSTLRDPVPVHGAVALRYFFTNL
jgi:hypothetical protein